ncbi:hypothetical protein EDD18DRAFT_1293742 [Armillaria luteobubalina]|uniref:FAD-binding domain-containing protein n=1 Tax=Armillaria luteobubalina TaxID=153913 RepID=A0AA39PHB4_9AGAR|nr:hypothetical protein EDD18DRAFT_1293742 [Armillaria luteobubalina]
MAQIPGWSNLPKNAALAIDFVIVGGGVAGFACAIALRRVGHHVLVLEKDATFPSISSPCPMPPNLSKILFHWGLKDELRKISVEIANNIRLRSTEEQLGMQIWDKEVLRETGGEFIFAHTGDLRRLLYDVAVAVKANVRLGARVETVNTDAQTVTLSTGEVLKADVIVGCDGPSGITRQVLSTTQEECDDDLSINMNMCCTTILKTLIMKDPQLRELYDHDIVRTIVSRGLHAHIDGQAPLKYWVNRFMVVMGAAVHPMPPGSVQQCALTMEDGAVLAKLFSHLHCKDQIKSFLSAFQDLRQLRCAAVLCKEARIFHYMKAEPGELQQSSDDMTWAKEQAHAIGILDAMGDLEENDIHKQIETVFGYNAEDDADNWWVTWGLLRERARSDSSESHMGEVAGTKNLRD